MPLASRLPTQTPALAFEDQRLEVDPRAGGRVTSLRLGDVEVLSGREAHPDNYGSTFWTSPQSDWGWPPPAEIDCAPYSLAAAEDSMVLTGPTHPELGVRVIKRFAVDRARRAFVLQYVIHNAGSLPRTYAPWEVSRVHSGGLSFFPSGTTCSGTLGLTPSGRATWYADGGEDLPPAGKKAFADGRGGLLAHAAGGVLFAKRFESVPPASRAPGQGTLEIYACPRYVELEVQGPYTEIAPGGSLAWSVTWFLRRLPENIGVAVGSADLLAFAESTIAG